MKELVREKKERDKRGRKRKGNLVSEIGALSCPYDPDHVHVKLSLLTVKNSTTFTMLRRANVCPLHLRRLVRRTLYRDQGLLVGQGVRIPTGVQRWLGKVREMWRLNKKRGNKTGPMVDQHYERSGGDGVADRGGASCDFCCSLHYKTSFDR